MCACFIFYLRFYAHLSVSVARELGERYTLVDVKAMVRDDKSLLDNFSAKEEADMIKEIVTKRGLKRHGVRANNVAAVVDAKHTLERLLAEVCLILPLCHDFCTYPPPD